MGSVRAHEPSRSGLRKRVPNALTFLGKRSNRCGFRAVNRGDFPSR